MAPLPLRPEQGQESLGRDEIPAADAQDGNREIVALSEFVCLAASDAENGAGGGDVGGEAELADGFRGPGCCGGRPCRGGHGWCAPYPSRWGSRWRLGARHAMCRVMPDAARVLRSPLRPG